MPVTPLPSATVILVRARTPRSDGQAFELFMVRRSDGSSFMGGAHVFPGGKLDETDTSDALLEQCSGREQAAASIPDLPATLAAGYRVAALRELFEEAGVLLARTAAGGLVSFQGDQKDRFGAWRLALRQYNLPLASILKEDGLTLALDLLIPYAWWVTPEEERKRFDARFYLAVFPPEQIADHDTVETTLSDWFSPREAIARYQAHDIHLVPPTLRTLEELSALTTLEEVLETARSRVVKKCQPKLVVDGSALKILLPGDPEHPWPGLEVSPPTRFVMEEGRWWSRQG